MGRKIEAEQPTALTEAAEQAGRMAFASGKTIADNPHSVASNPWSRRGWNGGFTAARQAAGISGAIK